MVKGVRAFHERRVKGFHTRGKHRSGVHAGHGGKGEKASQFYDISTCSLN